MGLTEVRRIVSVLELPTSIRDQSCRLFRQAQAADLLVGRSLEAFAAAVVVATCRCNGLPLDRRELYEVARVNTDRVDNAYAVTNRELGLPTPVQSPVQFIPRIASALALPTRVRHSAENLANQATDAGLHNGRNPAGLAAACLYEAARSDNVALTQGALAEQADVSKMTVRNRWRELRELQS